MRTHIVNENGSLNLVAFTINGIKMSLSETQSAGQWKKAIECIDTWRTEYQNGEVKYLRILRKKMYNKTRQNIVKFDSIKKDFEPYNLIENGKKK